MGSGVAAGEASGRLARPAVVLLSAAAVALAATGLPLFLAPGWAADHFAWKVSRFVAMTAGAWCLGTAAFALHGVARRRWTAARPCVVYTFAFGLTELGVVVYERERLRTGEVLTWPYLVALGLSVIAGAVALGQGGLDRLRPDSRPAPPVTRAIRFLMVFFVAFVGSLAAVAFAAPPRATSGAIFPEPLSLFSLRAFGVFYLSLTVAMLILVADRGAEGFLVYMRAGLVLVVLILVATAAHSSTFDLSAHPFQVLYPLAYVAAGVGAAASLWWARS